MPMPPVWAARAESARQKRENTRGMSSPVDWGKPLMRWTQGALNWLGVRPQWKNVSNYGKYMRR